jgi:23S rRNA (guanosine2251-2'-O)-methyltransferase
MVNLSRSGSISSLSDPGEGPQIETLLDNLRSAFNVGSIFRTSDGAGIRHLHLCGITPTPDHPKVTKTALGAELSIPWTQHWNGFDASVSMKQQGFRVWALEAGQKSQSLFDVLTETQGDPILLVVGNEVSGVDAGILDICDRHIWIPMQGDKNSLNVSVAYGIAAYFLRYAPGFEKTRN